MGSESAEDLYGGTVANSKSAANADAKFVINEEMVAIMVADTFEYSETS